MHRQITAKSELSGEYNGNGGNRSNIPTMTYRQKLLYEIEQHLEVKIDSIDSDRARVDIKDLKAILKGVREKLDADPVLVALDHEDRKILVERELEGDDQ